VRIHLHVYCSLHNQLLQAKFLNMEKARLLSLSAFGGNENATSSKFQHCKTGEEFIKVWKDHVEPYLIQHDGCFHPPPVLSPATILQEHSTRKAVGVKRKSSLTPPTLTPASKIARREMEEPSTSTDFDEKNMDQQLQEHFLGMSPFKAELLLN